MSCVSYQLSLLYSYCPPAHEDEGTLATEATLQRREVRWVSLAGSGNWVCIGMDDSPTLQKLGVILPSSCSGCWDPNLLPSILPSLPQHAFLSWTPNFSAPHPNRYLHIPSLSPHSSSPSDPAPSPPHTALGTTCHNPHQPQQHWEAILPPPCFTMAASRAGGRGGGGDAQLG